MTPFLTRPNSATSNAIVLGDELTRQAAEANGGVSTAEADIRHGFDALLAFAQSEVGFSEAAEIATNAVFDANTRARTP